MIKVKNLVKKFDDKVVLDSINTTFEPGKVNLVIGRSGSGKTVFLKCLLGLLTPEEGELFYGNKDFYSLSEKEQKNIRKEMGVVFQSGAIFDFLDVEGNVRFPLDMFSNMTQKEKIDRVNFCLEKVNLQGTNKLKSSELSGGMKKRLAIARAIALNPKYLFCDEPNSGLDPQNAVTIDELIYNLTHEFNTTTIVNTHDMNSVIKIGEKVIFLNEGHLWWEGSSENILNTDNKELRDFIFASSLAQKLLETS
ncbi:MAG TPA: ATP-binding cassette domain-containing protein [Bacteroidales bacterium]|nr:ATP-binding cassette domain-containing protein [Bacteroidales bacterium]